MGIKRRIFYSFHYENDVFRVQQIRNIGALEENEPVTVNEWEGVKKGGDKEIEKWINNAISNRTCVVVLVGEDTVNRPWIRYEISKAWRDGKGLLGIHIHNLKCAKTVKGNPGSNGTCVKGRNPFETFTIQGGKQKLSDIVYCYDPDSGNAYKDIRDNLEKWIEKAIEIRTNYYK